MTVYCQMVRSDEGYRGVIVNEAGDTIFLTHFEGCAEDAEAMLESAILQRGWTAKPWTEHPTLGKI